VSLWQGSLSVDARIVRLCNGKGARVLRDVDKVFPWVALGGEKVRGFIYLLAFDFALVLCGRGAPLWAWPICEALQCAPLWAWPISPSMRGRTDWNSQSRSGHARAANLQTGLPLMEGEMGQAQRGAPLPHNTKAKSNAKR